MISLDQEGSEKTVQGFRQLQALKKAKKAARLAEKAEKATKKPSMKATKSPSVNATPEKKQSKSISAPNQGKKSAIVGQPKGTAKAKATSSNVPFHVGHTVEIELKRLGINGEGVGYLNRQVLFVDGALPGEKVIAEIYKVEKSYAKARVKKLLHRSEDRVAPPCPIYEQCGGCSLQHMNYAAQLRAKREIVRESFEKYARFEPVIRETVGMDDPWGYRNKAQLPVGKIGEKVIAGLFGVGSHQLIEAADCQIHHAKANEIVQITRDVLSDLQIPIYDERKRTGVVRNIVARIGFETNEYQLTLVTRTEEIPRARELVMELRYRMPFVVSIMQNINPAKTSLVFGEKTVRLWGKEAIEEKLGNVQFSLSPRAFFQLNPEQTVKLFGFVKEAAELTGSETVIDAYCGVGLMGLSLAGQAKEVHGMDIIPEAIADAKKNAERNGIGNAYYHVGAAEKLLPEWVANGLEPNVVIVDPPRTGLDTKLIEALIRTKPDKIVYVSCNPATLAKNCADLIAGGYRVEWVQPVDMFPHTVHVECCVSLHFNK